MAQTSVKNRYLELIQDQKLEKNKSQEQLVVKLDYLRERLEGLGFLKSGYIKFFSERVLGFNNASRVTGMYIYGGVGVGKSMLMDLFFSAVQSNKKRRLHFHEFMNEAHENIDKARSKKREDPIKVTASKIISKTELICLDEMQINDVADAMIVGRLFEQFFKEGLVIVTTSNRHPQDLYKDGLNRQLFLPFIDLIKENMDIENIETLKDFRKSKLTGAKKYFIKASEEDSQKFEKLVSTFDIVSGEGLRLQVKGRNMFFPKFHNGVALIDFMDLCSVPLGSLDYLHIISHFRLLFLDKIPKLTKQGNDSAKRFITLIDTVYEKKIELICRAEAVPELLYETGRNQFEFQRTVSRLYEMQSKEWPNN